MAQSVFVDSVARGVVWCLCVWSVASTNPVPAYAGGGAGRAEVKCDGLELRLGAGEYRLQGGRRLRVRGGRMERSGAAVAIRDRAKGNQRPEPVQVELPVRCLRASAMGTAPLLRIEAPAAHRIEVGVAGVAVLASGATVFVEMPEAPAARKWRAEPMVSRGRLEITTTTGTITVIKGEKVEVRAATSGRLVSDVSVEVEHLDGQEPSKRAKTQPEGWVLPSREKQELVNEEPKLRLEQPPIGSQPKGLVVWRLLSRRGAISILERPKPRGNGRSD